jgi:hypothetical protein
VSFNELIIVAHEDDVLAHAMSECAELGGVSVEFIGPQQFSRLASVRVGPGGCEVLPNAALIVRAFSEQASTSDPNRDFAAAESSAMIRAVAALTSSPVMNRPTVTSFAGCWLGNVVRDIGTEPAFSTCVRSETYVGHSHPWPTPVEVQDLGTYATGYERESVLGDGPWRLRKPVSKGYYVTVTAAGEQTWLLGSVLSGSELIRDRTCEIARALALDLVSVSWCVSAEEPDTTPQVGRIDAFPSPAHLGPFLYSVADETTTALMASCGSLPASDEQQ